MLASWECSIALYSIGLTPYFRLKAVQKWLLYVITVCLAVGFTIAGFYALSVAGDMRKLPLQRLVMIAIVGLYSIRVIVGIDWLLHKFSYLQLLSSIVPALLVYCYFPGLK